MAERPLISVCLPTYNGERFLRDSVESVLKQTHKNFELLIGDDCSTDCSQAIVKEYALQDDRIRYWTNSSRLGLFANYNECMRHVSGDFIKLFAQDDLLEPENLEELVAVLQAHPQISLVSSAKHLTTEGDIAQKPTSLFSASGQFSGTNITRQLLTGFTNIIGEPSTTMFRRDSIMDDFDTTFHHLGDTDLWIKLLSRGDYYHLHKPLCTFRQHPQAATSRNVKGLLFALDLFRLGEKYEKLLAVFGMSRDEYRRRTIQCLVSFLQELTKGGLTWEEIKSINSCSDSTNSEDSLRLLEIVYFSLSYSGELENKLDIQSQQQRNDLKALEDQLSSVVQSESWKITQPLRDAKSIVGSILNPRR